MHLDDRYETAVSRVTQRLADRAIQIGQGYPPHSTYFVIYKQERVLEIWTGKSRRSAHRLFSSYPIAAMSGKAGPKRVEGDRQVPEGVYRIAAFNPISRFHLSLRLDYPNASDLVRSDKQSPGSDIYIHGDRKSIGCVAMTDPLIEEIYVLAKNTSQKPLSVYLFPCRMTGSGLSQLKRAFPEHASFWDELEPIDRWLQEKHRPPSVKIASDGAYVVGPTPGT